MRQTAVWPSPRAWCWRPGARRAALVLGGALAVAGCGTATAPASAPGAASGSAVHYRTVCAAAAALSRVAVTRTPSPGGLSAQRPPLARTIMIRNPTRVRALATAACALPYLPAGVYQCPLNVLGSLQLTFAMQQRRFPAVTVESGGCEAVRGLGHTRWAARVPGFWRTLARTTGIAAPLHSHQPWLVRHN
jgi:hypothetical protein